jgi:hypothetical protein
MNRPFIALTNIPFHDGSCYKRSCWHQGQNECSTDLLAGVTGALRKRDLELLPFRLTIALSHSIQDVLSLDRCTIMSPIITSIEAAR